LAVPRQNGKNAVLEVDELYKMIALGRKILHTAHEVKTARKAFIRLAGFFENERKYPELAALVREIRRTNGQEAIVLANGGSCEFVARSKGSGRGFTVDDLVLDEAQELSEDALAALLPTISAAPSGFPQLTMTGTPPSPVNNGEVWSRMRDAGVEGKDRRLAWFEWSCQPGVDLDDKVHWVAANPALGIRLNPETLADERAAMDDETFARERLGVWGSEKGHSVIDPDLWASLANAGSKPGADIAFAVDVPPERRSAVIAVAGRRGDGRVHLELVEQRGGTAWVASRVAELDAKWKPNGVALDPAGPVGSLIVPLANAGIEPMLVSGREMAAACGAFFDGVMDKSVVHLGQPELSAAVDAGRKRRVGDDAWAWSRKDTASDISPLVAVTLARHALGKEPKRKRKTGRAMFK
jgi:phage terminase large subunit-like protein